MIGQTYSTINHTRTDPSTYPGFKIKQLVLIISFSIFIFLITTYCCGKAILSYKEPTMEEDIWTDITSTAGKLELTESSDSEDVSEIE
jgi:hypothetical protein